MPAAAPIFISYARRDAAELAQRLHASLTAAAASHPALQPWLDRTRIEAGASWTTTIEQALDASSTLLALLTPGSYASDICRAEQLRALRTGKRVIPLLAAPNADRPLHLETANYRDFTNPSRYDPNFAQLLADLTTAAAPSHPDATLAPRYHTTYVTAPPLPRNYVVRPDDLSALRAALILDDAGPSVALTALRGMGGIGKTVLAQALAHDSVIQQAFPDGILWVTVGRESTIDLPTRMRELGKALEAEAYNAGNYDNSLACTHRLRNVLRDRAALLIVDDVWRASDVEPFLSESPRSRVLFTTRNSDVASGLGATEHPAGLLTPDLSREMLAKWSGLPASQLPSCAANLIKECGRLPLALSMTGAMLRSKPSTYWPIVLDLLVRADLTKIHAQFPDYPHTDLLRALQVSVDALREADPVLHQRYLSLAVWPEDTPLPFQILQYLWNLPESGVLQAAEQLISLSLAQRSVFDQGTFAGAFDGDSSSLILHDLLLDYIRAQHTDPTALKLIRDAIQLSSHILRADPVQFPSQITGRLLPYTIRASVRDFAASIAEAASAPWSLAPWLRLLSPTLHPPGTSLLRTLTGHIYSVNSVAFSPDGRFALSASDDHTLKLWDLDSGRERLTLTGHRYAVHSVAFSPNGRLALSGSDDNALKLWDLDTGHERLTLTGHRYSVNSVAFSPDGRLALSGSHDSTLKLWDLDTGSERLTLTGHRHAVNSVTFSPNGRLALSGSDDNTLKLWDLDIGQERLTLTGHVYAVNSVAFSPDGRFALSASDDHTLKLWDLDSGGERFTLTGHRYAVHSVTFSPKGRLALSASDDHTLKFWDLDTGRERLTLTGHSYAVNSVAFSPDGCLALSASSDNTLKLWDLDTGRERLTLTGHRYAVNSVAFSPDGRLALSASDDNTLKLWDPNTGHERLTLTGHRYAVNSVAFSPEGRLALSASDDNTLKLWDLDTGRERLTLSGHRYAVNSVAFSSEGRLALSASSDNTLKLWDLDTGHARLTLTGHRYAVNSVAFSPDGRFALSASHDNTLKLWNLDTGGERLALTGHSYAVNSVAFSPDGRFALSASDDHTLKLWDLDTGRERLPLTGHVDPVNSVAFSPDGRLVISASSDKTVKLWDLATGTCLATFTADASILCSAWSGDRATAGDTLGQVHFLRIEWPRSR